MHGDTLISLHTFEGAIAGLKGNANSLYRTE